MIYIIIEGVLTKKGAGVSPTRPQKLWRKIHIALYNQSSLRNNGVAPDCDLAKYPDYF